MAAAWANIASMNDGGSLSWSIECAPMGSTAARAAGATTPASPAHSAATVMATASVCRPGARLEPGVGVRIRLAPEGLGKHPAVNGIILRGPGEQGHRGAELAGVDPAEDGLGVLTVKLGEDPGALGQPRAEHRMAQIGARPPPRRDRVTLRHRTLPQTGDLGEDEPHPVPGLAPGAQLGDGPLVHAVLGGDKAREVVRVAHLSRRRHHHRPRPRRRWCAWWRTEAGGSPPSTYSPAG